MVSLNASATVLIDRPLEGVWAFVSDITNQDLWVDGMSETELVGGGELRRGSEIRGVYTYSGGSAPIVMTVVELRPPHRLVTNASEGPFPFVAELSLRRRRGATEVVNQLTAGSDHLATSFMFRFLPFIFRPIMARQLRKELTQLRALLEQDLSSP